MMTARYDIEADALYVTLTEGPVARTEEIDDRHFVDLDREGGIVGIELLYPGMGVDFASLAERYGADLGPAQRVAEQATPAPAPAVDTHTAFGSASVVSYTTVVQTVHAPLVNAIIGQSGYERRPVVR